MVMYNIWFLKKMVVMKQSSKNHGKNVKYGNVFQKIKLEMDTIIEINQPHMYMDSILIEEKDINLQSICGEYHYIKV